MIVSTYECLKEKYNTKINHHTKKHIDDLIDVIKMNTCHFGICYSNKEIEEMESKNKYNVEIIKSKWLSKHVKCSIKNIKETCSIDLEEYDTIVKTKCGHYFSVENIYEWIRNNNKDSCPLCRTVLI
jgi:glycyl-tRNA synthetase alpha subunit